MSITNGYATDDELKEWNGATAVASTVMRERAIEAASRAIDQYCDRDFYQVTGQARVFDACGPRLLKLDAFGDLVSIDASGFKTDDNADGTFETTWATSDYQLLPLRPTAAPELRPYTAVRAIAGRTFPLSTVTQRIGRIQITGTWGWPAVPTDIKQACLLLAARLFIRKESPLGVAGFGEFGQIRVRNTDPDVTMLLDPYRKYAVLVA